MDTGTSEKEGPRFYRVKEFSKKHGIPIGGLRHLIFYEKDNGFHKVVRRIGKAVYLMEDEFLNWLDEINGITTTNSK